MTGRYGSQFRRTPLQPQVRGDLDDPVALLAPIGTACRVASSATLPPSAATTGWSPIPPAPIGASAQQEISGVAVPTGEQSERQPPVKAGAVRLEAVKRH
ncbi:MAG TPA: hypothetical protein VGW38_28285 [Chloroflexota bacterium]|nr:hypothetical protein [Chloroflexota bacterium]